MMLLLFFQGATRRNKLICKFQLPGCLIFHTTNASAIVEIEVIVDKGSWLYVQIYIYTYCRYAQCIQKLGFVFQVTFQFSTIYEVYYGKPLWKHHLQIQGKHLHEKHPANPWDTTMERQFFVPGKVTKAPFCVEQFRWCLAGGGYFFHDLPLSNLLSFRPFKQKSLSNPYHPGGWLRCEGVWSLGDFICSRSRGDWYE